MNSTSAVVAGNSANTSRKADTQGKELARSPKVKNRTGFSGKIGLSDLPEDLRTLILLEGEPLDAHNTYRYVSAIRVTCHAGASWAQALYDHLSPFRKKRYDENASRVVGVNWKNPPTPNKTVWRLKCLDRIMRADSVIQLQRWGSDIQHAILDTHFQQFPFKQLDANFGVPDCVSADKLVNLTGFLFRHSGVEGRPFVKIDLVHRTQFDVSLLAQALAEYGHGAMSLSIRIGSTNSPACLADTLRRGAVNRLELVLTGPISEDELQEIAEALAADQTLEKLTLTMNLGPDLERLIHALRAHPKLQTLQLDLWGEDDANLGCIFLAAEIPNLKSLLLNLDGFYPSEEFGGEFAKLPGAKMTIVKPWWAKD